MFAQLITGICCLFLGSIPSGYLFGRLKGVDLRQHGSGNTGATNTARVLGKGFGLLTLLFDIAKGSIAVLIGSTLDSPGNELWACTCGALALFGHCFSPFLGFRGGKGVATGFGVFLVIAPLSAWLAIAIFAVSITASHYVSLSSILAAGSVPLFMYFHPDGARQIPLLSAIVCASLVILRHHANIRRLLRGTEPRWGKKAA